MKVLVLVLPLFLVFGSATGQANLRGRRAEADDFSVTLSPDDQDEASSWVPSVHRNLFWSCPAGNAGDGCSVFCPCSGSNSCEAWYQVCRAPGKEGDSCHWTKPCGSGLSCEAGHHVCRAAGKAGDPCHLTRPCGSGLTCEAGNQVCVAPGTVGDPCHLTRPCGDDLRCGDAISSAGFQICLPKCQDVSSAINKDLENGQHYSAGPRTFGAKWDGGVMPYVVHCDMEDHEVSRVALAMKEIQDKTSIRFKRYRSSEDDNYVIFNAKADGGFNGRFFSSGAGRLSRPGWQSVNIESFWFFGATVTKGVVIHEIMHALGWLHTQSRPDRNNYVTIHPENIISGKEGQFKSYNSPVYEQVQKCRPYDYESIMHYSQFTFSKMELFSPTITTKDSSKQGVIGTRDDMSSQDVEELQEYYFGTPKCIGTA